MTGDTALEGQSVEVRAVDDNEEKWETDSYLTLTAILICVVIYIGLLTISHRLTLHDLSHWGYVPAKRILSGEIWGLITAVFVHPTFMHLFGNSYWLFMLGGKLEKTMGRWWYLRFFLVAAAISTSAQLAFSGSTGVGASGVVYAVFGFMCINIDRIAGFEKALDSRTIYGFVIWLFLCMAGTFAGFMNVGNAAHVAGLLFGLLLGYRYRLQHQQVAKSPNDPDTLAAIDETDGSTLPEPPTTSLPTTTRDEDIDVH